jgi:hypothetical protein
LRHDDDVEGERVKTGHTETDTGRRKAALLRGPHVHDRANTHTHTHWHREKVRCWTLVGSKA